METQGKLSTLYNLGEGEAFGARWTIGSLLLAPLVAANSSYCAVPAVLLLGVSCAIAAFTCKDLKKLSTILPPPKTSRGRRERNLRSFGDFMGMWMSFLSHLVAVAICARILSATADHVTEGKTRRWLFGYETRALGEPWPDVLGVTVVLVVCAMFMCGLEESIIFTSILLVVLFIFSQSFTIFGLINLDIAHLNMPIPITFFELIAAGAPISYAYSVTIPSKDGKSLKKNALLMIGLPTFVLAGLCFFYSNLLKGNSVEGALPVTTLTEAKNPGICPILTVITVAGVSLALAELCPILFTILVALASPEWKVLTRSMTYESATTGSPVLAVFTAGSLAAILAFACPLSHMITLMNGSHLIGIAIQAFHYIILRCVPTTEQMEAGDVEYKRLGIAGPSRTTVKSKSKRGLWFIPSSMRPTKTLENIKAKVTKETEESECLLLDEYTGCATEEIEPTSLPSVEAVNEVVHSDGEPSDNDGSSGDDSTDIDAVVKEYRDTIQVVTAKPEARAPVPPYIRGAKFSATGAFLQLIAATLIATGLCLDKVTIPLLATGIPLWACGVATSAFQPAHKLGVHWGQCVQGPLAMLAAVLYLTPLLIDSWPAILMFAGAGVVIYARCERWCGDLAVQQARTALARRKMPATDLTGARLTHVDTLYISR